MTSKNIHILRHYIHSALSNYICTEDKMALQTAFTYIIGILQDESALKLFDLKDYIFLKLMESSLERNYTKKETEIEYLLILKSINADIMLSVATLQNTIKNGTVIKNHKKICYLDHNVFMSFIRGEKIDYEIPDDCIVPYSPAHIEEIDKSPLQYHQEELQKVREKTCNLEILFCADGGFCIFKEDPQFCYNRIHESLDRILAEQEKLLDTRLQDLIFDGYGSIKNRIKFNSQKPETFLLEHESLVNDILLRKGLNYNLEHIKTHGNCNDYNTINGFIHNLFSVMDICGFKKDNDSRRIRSSRLDIEHVLYASVADIFVTKDEKLRYRAMNFFSVLGKNIQCPILK